jgi:hypothetical protein
MQKTFRLLLSATTMAAGALMFVPQAQAAVKVGVLSCNVSSGWGVIFGSSRELHCNFQHENGEPEHYSGKISKFGVDIGYKSGGVMVWNVLAPSEPEKFGALEGSYAGATAGATVGLGAAVNVLVGGFERSFTLQPVSIEGNKGLNVAAGVASINLTFQPN